MHRSSSLSEPLYHATRNSMPMPYSSPHGGETEQEGEQSLHARWAMGGFEEGAVTIGAHSQIGRIVRLRGYQRPPCAHGEMP